MTAEHIESEASGEPDRGGKREAILSAALELFAERGFHGTPMPLVAEKAGVGAGTIYRYFESKEALVNALFQHWKRIQNELILEHLPQEASPREQFHIMWQAIMRFARENPVAFSFMELHHHAPYLDEASWAVLRRMHDRAYQYFEMTNRLEITKPLAPEVLMALIHGMTVGLFKVSRIGWFELHQGIIDATEESCWQAIRR
jgi:TetR/AcrR family transcriptional regulator, repressor of fatR-cypB operon